MSSWAQGSHLNLFCLCFSYHISSCTIYLDPGSKVSRPRVLKYCTLLTGRKEPCILFYLEHTWRRFYLVLSADSEGLKSQSFIQGPHLTIINSGFTTAYNKQKDLEKKREILPKLCLTHSETGVWVIFYSQHGWKKKKKSANSIRPAKTIVQKPLNLYLNPG